INKGGDYRLYYGNNDYIVYLHNNGEKIRQSTANHRLRDQKYYFKPGITWSGISSSFYAFRQQNSSVLCGDAGALIHEGEISLLGFLNSKVSRFLLDILNPTINIQGNDVERLPIIKPKDAKTELIVEN